tara:strand:- start:7725 stop:8549 length:825 start_codon:yes stop_codon:yes gene_type:complete
MRNNQNRFAAPGPNPAAPPPTGLSYEVPTEFVELPSKGRFYHFDHPLHMQETIEIKYMTAKEEDILSSVALHKQGLAIERLLENLIVDPNIDSKSLTISDRNAIMIAARASSYGNAYEVSITCNSCGEKQDYKFDLKKKRINLLCFDENYLNDCGVEYDSKNLCYIVTLPKSKKRVAIKVMTGLDEIRVGSNDLETNLVTALLSKFIISFDGNEDSNFIKHSINSMLAWDSRYLRNLLPQLSPSIELTQDFTCKHCNATEEMEVPLTAEFFWPR